jgi:hypothetical protein
MSIRLKNVRSGENNAVGIVRLETQYSNYSSRGGNDLPSFRGRKSRFKDIIEIRKRIKRLDKTVLLSR